mmetsp:Transcript_18763/g.53401  ORF Transcript_18763/g.53401 Transcript_18763/m.53401 type:complete len:231 (+) Transcript_18763:121-813(+)
MTPPSAQSILFQPIPFFDEEKQEQEETSLLFCRDELLAKFKEEYGHSCSVPTCCWPQNDQQLAQWVVMLRRYQHTQELIEQEGQFVDVRSFVLSGTSHVVQEPLLTAHTANAAALSCAIKRTLDVVTVGGTSSSHDDDSDGVEEATNNEGNTLHRNELLKDNMSQFYEELARARLGSDDISSACSSDEESDWDEEEEEDDLCFRGLVEDSSSSDLFDSFKSRYGGISEWP